MTRKKAAGFANAAIIILLLVLLSMTGGAFYWVAHALDQRDARISSLETQIGEFTEQDKRLNKLTQRVGDLAAQRNSKSAAEKNAAKLAELDKRLASVDKRLATLTQTSDQMSDLATRLDALGERVDTLANDLEQARRSDKEIRSAVDQGIKDYMAAQAGDGSASGAKAAAPESGTDGGQVFSLDDTDPILGNPEATVTIIEYSDMECPYCQRLHQDETIKGVVEDSDGQVNATFRHFPLTSLHGRVAVEAAAAAECVRINAGDQAFFSLVATYFERTRSGGDGTGTPLPEFVAGQTELDKKTVRSCMDSDDTIQRIRSDFETGRSNGINSTPTMIVYNHDTGNKRTVAGAVGADKLRQAVDALTQ